MTNLEIAVSCVARGWFVFPCKAQGKEPAIPEGFKAATDNETQVREWWTARPNANVGIATGASGLTVLDIDYGVHNGDDLAAYMAARDLPETYTVRTGRRPDFGVQLYFQTAEPLKSIAWVDPIQDDVRGDVRGGTGYVMAEGCHHPSGAFYEALVEAPIAPLPEFVRALRAAPIAGNLGGTNEAFQDDGGPIIGSRNVKMASVLGRYRGLGNDDDAVREYAEKTNEERCQPPLAEWELDRIVSNICKYPAGEPEPEVIIGKAAEVPVPKERPKYLTLDEFDNVKEPTFLIAGFLVRDAMVIIAGPVSQRKTLVVMNVVKALCTGEPLFGQFEVVERPERIYYLCPEMGAASFCKRMRDLGLRDYIGRSLFCLTLSQPPIGMEGAAEDEDLRGSVVILDTITRFIDGDENKSSDMRMFAARVMAMNRKGATMILLHHSSKGSSGTLDDGLRGSSELAAFVTSAWVTGLEDVAKPYESRSRIRNVKQRDFESKPFFLKPVKDSPAMLYDGTEEAAVVLKKEAKGQAEKIAKAAVASIFGADPDISAKGLRLALGKLGIKKGTDWVTAALINVRGSGCKTTG